MASPSTPFPAQLRRSCAYDLRMDTHTPVHAQTHNDTFLRINSRATVIKTVCRVHPQMDREKRSLVCSPGPQPLKWAFCVVEASDLV